MEIANLLQPMGMDPSATVAVGNGAPVAQAPTPDGAFALFFAQVMNTAIATVSPEMKPELQGEPAVEPEGEQLLQESDPDEKQPVIPADLGAELQALALLNPAPQPVPVAPAEPATGEGSKVEAVSATVVPEVTTQATATPVMVAKPKAEGDRAPAPAVSESAFVPAQPQPAAEPTAPAAAESGPVEITALSAQKEPAAVVRRTDAPASPVRETEVSPEPVVTTLNTAASVVKDAPVTERPMAAVVAAPAKEAGMSLRQAAAAKEHAAEQPAVAEDSGEAVVAREKTETASAVREAGFSRPATHEQAEQHLASPGKEMPAQPVTVAHDAVRETGAARQPSAPATTEAPLPRHEHIMQQVKEQLAVHSYKGGNDQISFTLHPEELGELKIMMRMDDQRLKVEIVAQNQTVREALMQNLEGLKETLSRQNITVDRFDVNTGGGTFNQAFHEGRHTGRDRHFQPYARFTGGSSEPEQKAIVTGWLPRENSLVDVRF